MSNTELNSDAALHRWPTKAEVELLHRTHSVDAINERWWYLNPRRLLNIRLGKRPQDRD